ncbi:phosphoribosyl-AMP cyclohydrolase [Moorella naiadis]|uniref:phosphoribosyl-AMP cyclohydrolase n=1 Tax=Moorella naiadis (nom. illeg.) TaxID=3093670 RepID=UPI003D9CB0D5
MAVTIPSIIHFNAEGLIPAIIQDIASGQVLMLAYMNRESLARTLATGETWFYSRSRRELWHKGATSGHRQYIEAASYDCDADALLFQVRQVGVACHEGEFSCFHNPLPLQVSRPRTTAGGGGWMAGSVPEGGCYPAPEEPGRKGPASDGDGHGGLDAAGVQAPALPPVATAGPGDVPAPTAKFDLGAVLNEVFRVIKERQATRPEGSYTAYLFNNGQDKILKKIGEEAGEAIIASKNDSRHEILYELADLYYHTLVLLAYHDLEPGELAAELAARR